MKYHHGNSVCISSQVGCRMGCRFCASTIGGKKRDLTASEMLEQVYRDPEDLRRAGFQPGSDGNGRAAGQLRQRAEIHPSCLPTRTAYISARETSPFPPAGIVPRHPAAGRRGASDHAGALSSRVEPGEKGKSLCLLRSSMSFPRCMDACRYYHDKTGRRLTFEYSLVGGVNDHTERMPGNWPGF